MNKKIAILATIVSIVLFAILGIRIISDNLKNAEITANISADDGFLVFLTDFPADNVTITLNDLDFSFSGVVTKERLNIFLEKYDLNITGLSLALKLFPDEIETSITGTLKINDNVSLLITEVCLGETKIYTNLLINL